MQMPSAFRMRTMSIKMTGMYTQYRAHGFLEKLRTLALFAVLRINEKPLTFQSTASDPVLYVVVSRFFLALALFLL